MTPLASFFATLAFFGVAFPLLHVTILWLRLPDLAALMLLAIPVTVYVAYCTQNSRAAILASALRIYASFALVVLSAGALVYLIG